MLFGVLLVVCAYASVQTQNIAVSESKLARKPKPSEKVIPFVYNPQTVCFNPYHYGVFRYTDISPIPQPNIYYNLPNAVTAGSSIPAIQYTGQSGSYPRTGPVEYEMRAWSNRTSQFRDRKPNLIPELIPDKPNTTHQFDTTPHTFQLATQRNVTGKIDDFFLSKPNDIATSVLTAEAIP